MNNNNLEVKTFLQIICITISNGSKYNKNALLDTDSDVKLLKGDLAIKLGVNVDSKILRIINAISKTSELESNQVSFKVLFKSHPNFIDIKNALVFSKLGINYQPINVSKLKKDLDHLRNLDLPTLNLGGVSLLLGTNLQHFILHRDFSYIRKISPTICSQIIIMVGF